MDLKQHIKQLAFGSNLNIRIIYYNNYLSRKYNALKYKNTISVIHYVYDKEIKFKIYEEKLY